ncbi:MAG: 2-dehydropantoate 2-reductase, partial [Natronospirillum sp.]
NFSATPKATVTDSDNGHCRHVELLPLADPAPIKMAIVTTKSHQVLSALTALQHCWAPTAEVLLLTNGLGPQDHAATCLPSDTKLWIGVTTEGALRTGAFSRSHTGTGETALGPWVGSSPPGKIAQWLGRSALDTLWLSDNAEVRTRVWQKLIVNCAINPLTAELGVRNGALSEPYLLSRWQGLVDEAVLVAQAEGLALTATELHDQVRRVIAATARNYSSMQQDVMHHRPTEANDILGTLARRASHHRLKVPQINRLWQIFQDQFE